LQNESNDFIFNSADKTDILNKYFVSVCVKDNNIMPSFEGKIQLDKILDKIVFKTTDTYKTLIKSKATCPPFLIDCLQRFSAFS